MTDEKKEAKEALEKEFDYVFKTAMCYAKPCGASTATVNIPDEYFSELQKIAKKIHQPNT